MLRVWLLMLLLFSIAAHADGVTVKVYTPGVFEVTDCPVPGFSPDRDQWLAIGAKVEILDPFPTESRMYLRSGVKVKVLKNKKNGFYVPAGCTGYAYREFLEPLGLAVAIKNIEQSRAAAATAVPEKIVGAPFTEIYEITGSSPAYPALSAVFHPAIAGDAQVAGLSAEQCASVEKIKTDIARCGLSIAGPDCKDGRFSALDAGWIAVGVSRDQEVWFLKGFQDGATGAAFVIVYESKSESAESGFGSVAVYPAPDLSAGLTHTYGLLSSTETIRPVPLFRIPAPGR